jgi:hypothetical protein
MTKSPNLRSSSQKHQQHPISPSTTLPPALSHLFPLYSHFVDPQFTAIMFARRLATALPRVQVAPFHSTARNLVQKGDPIPNLNVLVENSPGNKVNLAKEIKGKAVIVGTPAAFST